jgi:hypothetical protein
MRHLWYRRSAAKLVQAQTRKARGIGAVAGALVLGGALIVVLPASGAEAATCTNGGGHYYGQGWSGTGNYGTEAQIWTWAHWSVNKNNPNDFSDEAVWSINNNNINNALEVGFFSGHGNGDINGQSGWTNGMLPYYTLNNGANEYDAWGNFLPSNQYIWMFAQALDTNSYAYVNGQLVKTTNYVVNQPRLGFTQGEVYDNAGIWMGGGSGGDSSTLYWLDSSGANHYWAWLNDCSNAPYWVSSSGPHFFANGGT